MLATTCLADAVAASDPTGLLIQYGAIGVIAVLAIIAVRVLFVKVNEHALHERERADRLEGELRKLNETIRSDYITTLSQATRAIADALAAIRRNT